LPSVPCCTGSSTDLPAADRVTWSREGFWDTASLLDACAPELRRRRGGGSSVSRHYRTAAKRKRPPMGGRKQAIRPRLLGVALLELVDAAAGVHHLVLAGVERMGRRGNLDLGQRVLVAVLPLDRLLGGDGRAGEELEVGSHVLEHDFAVFGMDVGLHVGAPESAG